MNQNWQFIFQDQCCLQSSFILCDRSWNHTKLALDKSCMIKKTHYVPAFGQMCVFIRNDLLSRMYPCLQSLWTWKCEIEVERRPMFITLLNTIIRMLIKAVREQWWLFCLWYCDAINVRLILKPFKHFIWLIVEMGDNN